MNHYIETFNLTINEYTYCALVLSYWHPTDNPKPFASVDNIQSRFPINPKTKKRFSVETVKRARKGCEEKGVFKLFNDRNPETGLNEPSIHWFDPKKVLAAWRKHKRGIGVPLEAPKETPAPRKYRPEVDDSDKPSSPWEAPDHTGTLERVCGNCQNIRMEEGVTPDGRQIVIYWCRHSDDSITASTAAKECDDYKEQGT
jgi:hypothetical protein